MGLVSQEFTGFTGFTGFTDFYLLGLLVDKNNSFKTKT